MQFKGTYNNNNSSSSNNDNNNNYNYTFEKNLKKQMKSSDTKRTPTTYKSKIINVQGKEQKENNGCALFQKYRQTALQRKRYVPIAIGGRSESETGSTIIAAHNQALQPKYRATKVGQRETTIADYVNNRRDSTA